MGACAAKEVSDAQGAVVLFFPDHAMPCRHFLKGEACPRRACSFAHEATSLVRHGERSRFRLLLQYSVRRFSSSIFTILAIKVLL